MENASLWDGEPTDFLIVLDLPYSPKDRTGKRIPCGDAIGTRKLEWERIEGWKEAGLLVVGI